MSSTAPSAVSSATPITPVATGTVRSVRGKPAPTLAEAAGRRPSSEPHRHARPPDHGRDRGGAGPYPGRDMTHDLPPSPLAAIRLSWDADLARDARSTEGLAGIAVLLSRSEKHTSELQAVMRISYA